MTQNNFKVNLSGRGHNYNEEDIVAVIDAMKTADPLTQGKYQREFEEKFSVFNQSKNCFAVSSCTGALELVALLCRLGKTDEVIIPAHTFCATAIPFARTSARIVWADIDPDTRVVSAETIMPLITKQTKVIVVVHLYGLMAPMPDIMEIAQQHNLIVVEDCAQAIGASIKGIRAGNFADFACFSFHTHKNMSTLGEGGMLVVKDGNTAKLVPGLRHNGIRTFEFEREKYWIPAMSNVDFDMDCVWPYNFCIGEVQCAVGIKLLDRLDKMNEERNARATIFMNSMSDYPELVFQKVRDDYSHCYHLLSARYDGKAYNKTNHDFIDMMAFTYSVKVIVQYYPLYRYPMFIKAGFGNANCPNTEHFFDNMVSFPFHHWMSDNEFDYMIDATKKTLERLRDR
ncbi:pyridoxal phosphate-dependent aminotransferase [Candidatus Magnetobacterium bavaricum]|uniref:Pyridoxal phosphate-dependent aminotransferase n=1 Tax=Candidatus Magnetobacterium bavaricum TaxID=29290 RepID=A0A0F3GHI8_9BACT|nr:pyridoxal phosphate-dependent aminotransferase [Candidatus Magnetobacterium bavaricum]